MNTVLLFQDPGILSPYLQAAITLWPVWVVVAVGVGAIVKFRYWEKAGISDTNEKNIEGLRKLLETRDTELEDAADRFNGLRQDATAKLSEMTNERDTLQVEYRALAGVVVSELIHWAGRYDEHQAELIAKDSEIRILNARLEIMIKREAENAEIHKSQ